MEISEIQVVPIRGWGRPQQYKIKLISELPVLTEKQMGITRAIKIAKDMGTKEKCPVFVLPVLGDSDDKWEVS